MNMREEYERTLQQGGYKVLPKTVLKFSGDAVAFLKGLTTNDMEKNTNAFLDRRGKVVAFAYQKVVDDNVYVAIEKQYVEALEQHLRIHLKLSKTSLEETTLQAVHVIGQQESELSIPMRIGTLMLLEDLTLLEELREIPDEVYEIIRIENNISIQGIDFKDNMFLETNWDDVVSYTKGCYLGQEIICRVHNLGKPAKKLVRILFDELPDKVTAAGKEVGTITSSCFSTKYNKYLAFVMLKRHEGALDAGQVMDEEQKKSSLSVL